MTTRQELNAQTQTEHFAWVTEKEVQAEKDARKFDGKLAGMSKKELTQMCEEFGVEPSTPTKMRVALYRASLNAANEAINEMHKLWMQTH